VKILLVDDEKSIRVTLGDSLEDAGHELVRAGTFAQASGHIAAESFDCLITDLRLPDGDGLELLVAARKRSPDLVVLVITGHGSVDSAVQAMRMGAYDYLQKPFLDEEVLVRLARCTELRVLRDENEKLRASLGARGTFEGLVGASPVMQAVYRLVERVAESEATVLVGGGSGTGKELVARALHQRSRRSAGPFVALGCAAVPESLLEDELFGHVKGAFTGAHLDRKGLFEEARGGTLFLDDIDDLKPELQGKLLRVLQERQIRRIGSDRPAEVDVRVVAATKTDLGALAKQGRFREDLFYRLNVVALSLPSLAERVEDIPALVEHFIARHGTNSRYTVSPEILKLLAAAPWPGNVRELENAVCRAIALTPGGGELRAEDLIRPPVTGAGSGSGPGGESPPAPAAPLGPIAEIVAAAERAAIERALAATGGVRAEAAKLLGISRKNLWEKMTKLKIAASDKE
jgi:DNA-binding NtrC family response regulator